MKKLLLFLVCLVLIFSGLSCSKEKLAELSQAFASAVSSESSDDDYNYEESALRMETAVEYTNSYLDFSFTVPQGWWLYSINDINFSENPSDTENLDMLDISYGEDAGYHYSYLDLISIANLQDSSKDNHVGFDISAEMLDGINTIEEYMEYYESYILQPDENTTYELRKRGHVPINDVRYETRTIEVIRKNAPSYYWLSLTRPVGNGYFLTILTSYWPDNRNAEMTIITGITIATLREKREK